MTNTQPTKTSYQRKYTEDQVLDLLKKNNIMSARQISDEIGCHKKTVESLIKKMLESDSINRVNVRTESKPLWVYSLKKGVQGEV